MLAAACFFEMQPPRLVHGMTDKFIARLPYVSTWATRVGQLTGLPQHARRLLNDERLLMVFPEGAAGTAKLYKQRSELVRFGTGFVRLALETGCPISPTAVLGAADAVPTVANATWLGRVLGVPYVPVTPYLLPLPLPARLSIRFGAPLHFAGNGQEDDRAIAELVDQVKAAILGLIGQGKITEATE
jgi:1-acyl-sn-glycerol-3-phosphate acyltransferase